MPFGFADRGIRCGKCGHFLNVLSQAIPEMPDPFPVICPYCGHNARYAKSAICSDMPAAAGWAPIVLIAIAAIMAMGLVATRAHSAEPLMQMHSRQKMRPVATQRMPDALYHLRFRGVA